MNLLAAFPGPLGLLFDASIVMCGFDIVVCGFDIVMCGFDIVYCILAVLIRVG